MTVVDNVKCEKCCKTVTMGLYDIWERDSGHTWKLQCDCGHVQSGEFKPGTNQLI